MALLQAPVEMAGDRFGQDLGQRHAPPLAFEVKLMDKVTVQSTCGPGIAVSRHGCFLGDVWVDSRPNSRELLRKTMLSFGARQRSGV